MTDVNQNPFVSFCVEGEPASKANSRRMVVIGGRPRLIKSKKALEYETYFAAQCPALDPPLAGDVCVEADIWYGSRRPDLDESLILDLLQGRVILNDRQVKKKIITWMGVDKERPRADIRVYPLSPA